MNEVTKARIIKHYEMRVRQEADLNATVDEIAAKYKISVQTARSVLIAAGVYQKARAKTHAESLAWRESRVDPDEAGALLFSRRHVPYEDAELARALGGVSIGFVQENRPDWEKRKLALIRAEREAEGRGSSGRNRRESLDNSSMNTIIRVGFVAVVSLLVVTCVSLDWDDRSPERKRADALCDAVGGCRD